MAPLVSLHCLGTPTVYLPDGSVLRFRVKKHLALFVFLAMEPRTHRRDRLAELLWPDASAREGRHSLATALSVLRGRIGRAVIEAGRDTVRLGPGTVALDLDRLAVGDILGSDLTPTLDVAPLLEDFDIADAPEWGQWRDAQTARWQPAIREALLRLIDRSRRHGDTRTMERLADSLLAIEPLSEEGIRSKMESRAFAGDRLSALRHFEEWKARLADEVGAQPGELVEGMAIRLRRRGWERESQPHIAPVHTDQWKNRPFVARGREYRQLYEGWEGCQRGAPRHVILTGDSGVGKSTLAERLATAAGLQGAVSARTQCHEVERDVPYAAVGALAVSLLDRPGASAVAPEWLGELGRVVGEVRQRFPNAPPPLEAEGETVRIRIADAFTELAMAVAEEQPLVLVFDDLHLADDASVAVLHHLLRRLEGERILVLFTARPGEMTDHRNAQRLLERSAQVGLSGVSVPPLTPDEADEMLDSVVAARGVTPPTPAARRALLRASAGYPMVLELLTDDWQSHGERCLALTMEGMTEDPATRDPGQMYGRILERLTASLEPSSRNVLNLASVLGARLNDFTLYGLVDLTLAETMGGLSRLASARILRDAGEGLEFINELMRVQAYSAVPSSVRRVLHSKVADVLIGRAEGGEPQLGLEIAWHCVRARRKEEFARYLISGTDESIEQGAHADAERALLTAIPGLEGEVKAEAQYRLALVLQDQGRWEESKRTLDGIDVPTATEALTSDCSAARTIAEIGALSAFALPDYARTHPLLVIAQSHPSVALRLRAAGQIASYSVNTSDATFVSHAIATLDALARTPLAPLEHGAVALIRAQLLWPSRRFPEMMALLKQATAIAEAHAPHGTLSLRCALGTGVILASSGYYRDALPHLHRAATLARRIGNVLLMGNGMAGAAMCHLRLGQYAECLETSRRVLRDCANDTSPTFGPACHFYTSFALAMLNAPREATHALNLGSQFASHYTNTWVQYAWSLWSADILRILGEDRRAASQAAAMFRIPNIRFQNVGLAGAFCRWFSQVRCEHADIGHLDGTFAEQVNDIKHRDAVDRAEIGIAAIRLRHLGLVSDKALHEAVAAIPDHLPADTWRQLKLLGADRMDAEGLVSHGTVAPSC